MGRHPWGAFPIYLNWCTASSSGYAGSRLTWKMLIV